jgi:hypothetical protein
MINVVTWAQEDTRTARGSLWIAECALEDGRVFTARSRSGALNELARQLVEAGVPDAPMQVYDTRRGLKTLSCRSFHAAAQWTFTEGNRPLQRIRYQEYPTNISGGISGKGQDTGESVADAVRDG